jgi:hypothetical protein
MVLIFILYQEANVILYKLMQNGIKSCDVLGTQHDGRS